MISRICEVLYEPIKAPRSAKTHSPKSPKWKSFARISQGICAWHKRCGHGHACVCTCLCAPALFPDAAVQNFCSTSVCRSQGVVLKISCDARRSFEPAIQDFSLGLMFTGNSFGFGLFTSIVVAAVPEIAWTSYVLSRPRRCGCSWKSLCTQRKRPQLGNTCPRHVFSALDPAYTI